MPALTPEGRPLLLVTGANGYVASHIINALLEAKYRVRGTVRSEASIPTIMRTFSRFGNALELVIVTDITTPGAFDEALEGVNGIMHIASPLALSFKCTDDAIKPAVQGTLNVLQSARSRGSISRIIICSSDQAIHPPPAHVLVPTVFSEEHWNEVSPQIVKERGDNTDLVNIYAASKALADKVTWKFHEDNKDSLNFDIVSLHPSVVLGPVLYDIGSPEQLGASGLVIWNILTGQPIPAREWDWIDARDVAQLFVRALQTPEAGGQRIIITSGLAVFQDLLDIARNITPPIYNGLPECVHVLEDESDAATNTVCKVLLDLDKASRILGMGTTFVLKTKEETMRDSLKRFKALEFEL